MTDTLHLGLPLIEASQAQKHVTHNEAIVALDAIVQLSVKDSTHTAPPAAVEGDRYKVASGATGDWAAWDLNIALYTQGAWQKLVPQLGWMCFDEATGAITVWQGAPKYWVDIAAAGGYVTFQQTISPAQITADQNDYNPDGLSTAGVLRLSTDLNSGNGRKLTGLTAKIGGSVVALVNVGSNPLVLSNQDAGSTAANRFLIGRNHTLQPNEALALCYDATDSRWRLLNRKSRPVGLFHVVRGTNQTGLLAGTFNKLQFDTKTVDADGWYDSVTNFRYTPQEPGWYFFYCDAQITYGTAGASKEGVAVAVVKNGTIAVQGGPMLVMTSATIDIGTANCAGLVKMNGSTDYVEFKVYCGQGSGTSSTNAADVRNFGGGWKVADP